MWFYATMYFVGALFNLECVCIDVVLRDHVFVGTLANIK